MTYNFDEEINRLGTSSVKWEYVVDGWEFKHGDHADPKHGDERLLPLWVADMDFRSPPEVIDALVARARHGIFGYTMPGDDFHAALIDWMARRYGLAVQKEWIVLTPGVVPALNMLIQTFIQPGEKVLLQPPVYHPFFHAVENNGAGLVTNPLVLENGRYHMDFDDLARKTADPAVKMAILCSPHNPIARVWTADELRRFGEICLDNDVLVVSDEIHCDLIHPGHTFTSFAALGERFLENSVVCMAPSKTFNLAGLKLSNLLIANPALRQPFQQTQMRHGLLGANVFGLVAAEAAYRHGEPWLAAVMDYVADNARFMQAYLAEHLPQLRLIPPEGTYLAWLDCRALEMAPAARKRLLMDEARVYLDEGEIFGAEGAGFERFNLACPRSILAEALARIKTAVAVGG